MPEQGSWLNPKRTPMSFPMDDGLSIQTDQADPYDELPECIRQYYSRSEYLWLPDALKAELIEMETEPEWT